MSSIFDIGTRSLTAAQYALSVTSKNIANANNPFYSRREVELSEAFGTNMGNGMNVSDVRRIFDDITNKHAQKMASEWGKASSFAENLQTLEFLFDGQSNGLNKTMDESLTALNNLNINPASVPTRVLYLNQINNMVTRMKSLDGQLSGEQQNINNTIKDDVIKINQSLQQLAQLNTKIMTATDIERPDLLDTQDALIHSIAQYIGVNTHTDETGMLSMSLDNGTPLLSGDTAYTLVTHPSDSNHDRLDIAVEHRQSHIPITNLISRGEMAGLLAYQNNALNDSKNALGRIALVYAQKMNDQNKLGVDLNGNLGGLLFKDINATNIVKNRIIPHMSNQGVGDMSVVIDDAGQLTSSDYELTFDTSTHYRLVRKSDNQSMGTGDISTFPYSIHVDGFSLNIDSGTFAPGDMYTVSPTKNGARDIGVEMRDASKLALGFPVIAASQPDNKGNGLLVLTAMRDTSTAAFSIPKQLNPPIRVEFTSETTYQLINALDGSVMEAGMAYDPANGADVFPTPAGFDPGYSVYLSGNNQAGDAFTLNYNHNGVGDNRNGLAMKNLTQQGTLDHASLNFNQAYSAIGSSLSSTVNMAKAMLESSETMKKQADFRRDQISAVSLQEETINLTRFQQAYQASAQIIDVGRQVFETLMSMTRR